MKILHVLNEIAFSGAEVMLREAAPVFRREGIELHALSTGSRPGEYAHLLEDAGFRIHHIPFRRSGRYLVEVFQLIRRERFRIVHIHAERGFFWHVLAARIAGARVLRTVHTSFHFTGYLRWKRMLQRFLARRALFVTFISVSAEVSGTEYRRLHNPTVVIPNWVDHESFRPPCDEAERRKAREHFGLSEDEFVIVSVGACVPEKNHKDTIAAVAELGKSCRSVRYLHVGDGPGCDGEKEFARERGVRDRVSFTGQIMDVRRALISADLFVMTSRHEGLSRAGLEAMSCALPVIAYNTGGWEDIIDDGKNGFVVEPNPEAVIAAIAALKTNPDQRRIMSSEARKKVLLEFEKDRSVSMLADLYGRVL